MAADFPNNIPVFTDLDGNQTLAANNHAARHNKVHEEVAAIAAKVGIDGSADADSLDKITADLRTDVDGLLVDPTTKAYVDSAIATAVAAAKQALYPVGSYYTNETDSTNPGTLLGFGTWVAASVGRVPVGKASSGTFQTAGSTGGAETHTLTPSEMPSHNHGGKIWGTSNGDYMGLVGGGQGGWGIAGSTNNNIYRALINSDGGGGAHNNLQPYIVVYIWKRTA